MKKKILVVYPHNFFARRMGIDSRCCELMKYFKARNFSVDLFSLKNFVSAWENQDPHEDNLINELFLYDFVQGSRAAKLRWKQLARRILKGKIARPLVHAELPDYAFPGMKKQFKEILSKKQYDFIIIAYVHWANLIDPPPAHQGKLILDLSDFTTLNLFDMTHGRIDTAALLAEEIRRVNLFETVMCISAEEQWFFSRFAPHPEYHYIPFFMKKNKPKPAGKKDFDILFIGSDNAFNKEGIDWFFKNVHTRLNPGCRTLIAGQVASFAPEKENVTAIPYVPNLADIYHKSRIAICPLLGGTGMKIKVIEALSYGLPMVTTAKGIAGFPVKTGNGCLTADSNLEFAQHINRLLTDAAFYKKQARAAGDYFLENFEESLICSKLDLIFKQIRHGGVNEK